MKNINMLLTALFIALTCSNCQWGENLQSEQSNSNITPVESSPTPTATPTPTPTPTPSPTPHSTPTPSPTPPATPTPSPTPPLDQGWTPIAPSADSRIVYLSTTGTAGCRAYLPSEVGTDPFHPAIAVTTCRTLGEAYDLLRNGAPDWVLLKRGETFNLSEAFFWEKSGRAPNEMMVLGAYGTSGERPKLVAAAGESAISAPAGQVRSHWAILDLHILSNSAPVRDANGINLWNNWRDVLIEGNRIEGFSTDLLMYAFNPGAEMRDIRVRRNVLMNAYYAAGEEKGFGIFGGGTLGGATFHNGLFEENTFVRTGLRNGTSYENNFLSHAIYMADDGETHNFTLVMRGNLFLHNADGGKLNFDDLLIDDNFYQQNAVGVGTACCGLNNTFSRNVILYPTSYSNVAESTGILLGNSVNLQVSDNIMAHNKFRNYSNSGTPNIFGINTESGTNLKLLRNIVYDWCNENLPDASAMGWYGGGYSNTLVEGNEYQQNCNNHIIKRYSSPFGPGITHRNNKYFSQHATPFDGMTFTQWVAASGETGAAFGALNYLDPHRDTATYMGFAFGNAAGVTAFENAAINQSKWSWNPDITASQLNSYIRAGFNR